MSDDCYLKREHDEPSFTLLGRDKHAAILVNLWAAMRRIDGDPSDAEKIEGADKRANEMVGWLIANRTLEPVGIAGAAYALAVLAEMCGAVVTIGQEPLQPLAMGNYRHTVSVRPKRERAT